MYRRQLATIISLLALLLTTWLVYRPGLGGPFLFDDYANLPALGAQGPIDNSAALARYLTSGIADPTGRPLAMATFLLDAHDWPAAPEPFKRTNLLIHLLNGLLLFFLLRRLGQAGADKPSPRALAAAWLGAALWLLHPLFVSTTLYIVQREAMLPCTFAILGLLGWLAGRDRFVRGKPIQGSVIAVASISTCTLLGVASKANGLLLPAYVLVLEYFLSGNRVWVGYQQIPPAAMSRYRHVILWPSRAVTALTVILLIAVFVRSFYDDFAAIREWTVWQRVLTEPRILCQYLYALWAPSPYPNGLFNDQVAASTGPFTPWTTLPSILFIATLIAASWHARAHAPAWAAAVAFFLVGHLVESTSVPLELYFEHRNYVPAMILFWPFARWVTGASSATPIRWRYLVGASAIALCTGFTLMNTSLWGNERDQAELWAELNPGSNRAQAYAASVELARGNPVKAERRLRRLMLARRDQVQLAFNLLAARCAQGEVDGDDINAATIAMRTTRDPGTLFVTWFTRALASADSKECKGLDMAAITKLLDAGLANSHVPAGRRQDLLHIRGIAHLRQHNGDAAAKDFDEGIALDPRLPAALEQASELGAAGYPALGLRHLKRFDQVATTNPSGGFGMPRLHEWVLARQDYWRTERAKLEQTLHIDAQAAQTKESKS